MIHAATVLMAAGSIQPAPPAAKALLATLAKLLVAAHAADADLRDERWVSSTGVCNIVAAVATRGGARHA